MIYKATVGADFLTKQITKGENIINLQLWDTAGSEKYHSITSGFYRNSETCILVFDLTNKGSFENVEVWRKEFLENLNPPEGDKYPFVLIGNKSDLKEAIQVQEEDIQNYCNSHNNMPYYLCSAQTSENVEDAFLKVADLAFERNTQNDEMPLPEIKPIQIIKEPEEKKCC
jgi:small GTP-binding protein